MPRLTSMDRLLSKAIPEPNSGCWLWEGATCGRKKPYGKMGWGGAGKSTGAHRASYILHNGEIPAGKEIDHKCRNPICVNPEHLQLLTHEENVAGAEKGGLLLGPQASAAARRAKSHCPKGHSYKDAIRTPQGWRRCRQCFNAKERARTASKRECA